MLFAQTAAGTRDNGHSACEIDTHESYTLNGIEMTPRCHSRSPLGIQL
jgi:hypothetical protein